MNLHNKSMQPAVRRSFISRLGFSAAADLNSYIDTFYFKMLLAFMLLIGSSFVLANEEPKSCDSIMEALVAPVPEMISPTIYRPIPKTGFAVVEFTIERDGSVTNAIVVKSSEYKLWDISVAKTIVYWEYPKMVESCRTTQKIRWTLE